MAIAPADARNSYRIATGKGYLSEMAPDISPSLRPAVVSVDDDEDEADEYVSNLVEQIAYAMLDDDEISALKKGNVVSRAPAPVQHASHCPVQTPKLKNSGIWSTPLPGIQSRYVPLYHNDTEASYVQQKRFPPLVRSVASLVPHTCTSETRTQELEAIAAVGLGHYKGCNFFTLDAALRARAKFDVKAPTNGCSRGMLLPSHVGIGHQADFLCSSAMPIKMASEVQTASGFRFSTMANSLGSAKDGLLRRESTGTGVFLPRVHVTNASQRRRQVSYADGSEGKAGCCSMKR